MNFPSLQFKKFASDTYETWSRLPCYEHKDFGAFCAASPHGAPWVAVEMGGVPLADFVHPERAVYLLGAEDTGLPQAVTQAAAFHVALPTVRDPSFNVAAAGSILMYDRYAKRAQGKVLPTGRAKLVYDDQLKRRSGDP